MLTRELLRKIRKIEIVTERLVRDRTAGQYHSVFKGAGIAFSEVRQYMPGDDIRRIDWKLFGRTDRHYIKLFEAETNANFAVLLDVSSSMNYTSHEVTKLDYARYLAAALLFFCNRQRDRVGLVVFQKDRANLVLPPTNSVQLAQHALQDIPVGGKTPLAAGLTLALQVINQEKRVHPDVMPMMILLTDGSSTDGVMTVRDAVRLARHHGVRVYAIGIGAIAAGGVQRRGEGLDEPVLKHVAARTGGRYFHAGDGGALERIYEALERYEPTAIDERHYRPSAELYAWPLSLALALALAALAAGPRAARPAESRP